MNVADIPDFRLAGDPDVGRRLGALLARAIPPLLAHAAPLQPRLLALMGSAASGEASAVEFEGRWLPLSDLDLGLFVESRANTAQRDELRNHVLNETRGEADRLGFAHNPIDVGIFPLFYLARLPVTMELAALFAQPRVVWGDATCLDEVGARPPERPVRPFEAVRLFANRVVESFVDKGDWLAAGVSGEWSVAPARDDWRAAHRWSKLVLDCAKARLAADGVLEASVLRAASRLGDAGQHGAPQRASEPTHAARGAIGPEHLCAALHAWAEWRARPSWPPPSRNASVARQLGASVVQAAGKALGIETLDFALVSDWRRLLGDEGGAPRERLRRWARLMRDRPRPVTSSAALRYGARWVFHAWPESHAISASAAAWIVSGGEDASRARGLRSLLRREAPTCAQLAADRWDASWSKALAEWIRWTRATGT